MTIQRMKTIPFSMAAEKMVLGAILLAEKVFDIVFERVSINDFYQPEHRLLAETMVELHLKKVPIDLMTMADQLKKRNRLEESGGEAYLFEMAGCTASIANVGAYADIIKEKSVLRSLLESALDIEKSVHENEGEKTVPQLIEEAQKNILNISESNSKNSKTRPISECLAQAMERLAEMKASPSHITGLPTGFEEIDNLTLGLQKGELFILAARPSMGKTALAMNIAEKVALNEKKPVYVFSFEMSADQLAFRFISSVGSVSQSKIRTAKMNDMEWLRVGDAVSKLANCPMLIYDGGALSPMELRSQVRKAYRNTNGELSLIIIDYLQLMSSDGDKENRNQEISQISRSLKNLARELNIPILALAQLSRGVEQRTNKRPLMSDLRDSGSLEQDADIVAFIYRDEYYNLMSPDKGTAEIIFAKQRNGPTDTVKLKYLGEFTRFEDQPPYGGY